MLKKIFKILLIIPILFLFILPGNNKVFAKSKYVSNLSEDEIGKIFKLEAGNIKDPWQWLSESKTYTIIETDDQGYITYWWNAPNIQMSAQNTLYDTITFSGYGQRVGEDPSKKPVLVNIPEANRAKTGLQRYGLYIQNPTYFGERPLTTISITGVLTPDGFFDGVKRAWNFIFTGKIVEYPTEEDLSTLLYVAPRDYDPSGITFKNWIRENWYKHVVPDAKHGGIDKGQILLKSADPKTGKDASGKMWVKDTVINQNGLAKPGLTPDEIQNTLKAVTGDQYQDVVKGIILASKVKKSHHTERVMPYDLTRMTSKDRELYNGITDPRSEIQQSLLSTGYDKGVWNNLKSSYLSWSSKLAEYTIALNQIARFSFFEKLGLNPTDFWDSKIMEILMLIMFGAFTFYLTRSAYLVIRGNHSLILLFSKICALFLSIMLIYAMSQDSKGTYNDIKSMSTTIFNLGNSTLQADQSINSLMGGNDSTPEEKEDTEMWLPYFNAWTRYQTSYSLLDKQQVIDTDDGRPETNGLQIPKIGNTEQKIWSTVLASAATTEDNYSGQVYRMVDHFMAPRISGYDGISVNSIKVEKNENYKQHFQTSFDLAIVFMQMLLLFVIVIKVLLFLELMINIAMLLINLALAVSNKNQLIKVFKELGVSVLNIMFANMACAILVWASMIVEGWTGFALAIFLAFLIFKMIGALMNSTSIFVPKSFRMIGKAFHKLGTLFQPA